MGHGSPVLLSRLPPDRRRLPRRRARLTHVDLPRPDWSPVAGRVAPRSPSLAGQQDSRRGLRHRSTALSVEERAGRAPAVPPAGPRRAAWGRAWACADLSDDTVGSAKRTRRWRRLLEVAARLDDRAGEGALLAVAGRRATAGSAAADALLSGHLGRAVRVTPVVPVQARLRRQLPDDPGPVPAWMTGAEAGQETVTEVSGALPEGRFVDFEAVHIVTSGAPAGTRPAGWHAAGRPPAVPPEPRPWTCRLFLNLVGSCVSARSFCESSCPLHVAWFRACPPTPPPRWTGSC